MASPSPTYRRGDAIPGTQYKFVRKIGEGGHGEVYEVEHGFLESRAVMKLLHGHHVARQQLTQRMTREAKTLAKLRHPNIVEVSDGGLTQEEASRPYFVMEALNGMPVRDLLGYVKGGVGALAAIRIVIGVLEALEHAHRSGVIHRDIKPDNIFLHRTSADVTVTKVLDFGIAHLLEGRRFTGRHFVGTPRYAAPEQLRGETPSPVTDVYAAGLVLYELLTGEPPFADRKEIGPLIEAHMHSELPAPSVHGKGVPRELDAIVARFTAKAPTDRPPSAFAGVVMLREIATRLEATQSGDIFGADFQTAQTPMENMMAGVPPGGASVVRESSQFSSRGPTAQATPQLREVATRAETPNAPQATAPLVDGLAGGTMRLPASLGYEPTSPSDEQPTPPRDASRRDSSPPPIDRSARTNTVLPDFGPRAPKVDTMMEPSLSPAPPGAKHTTPIAAAHLTPSAPPPSYYGAPSPTPVSLPLPPEPWSRTKTIAAVAMALITVTALGVPLWLRYGRARPTAVAAAPEPAPTPASAVASEPAPASAPAATPASATTPEAAATPASAPMPASAPAKAPAAAPAKAPTASPGRPVPRPAPAQAGRAPATPRAPAKPVDPSSIGFD